MKTAFAFDLDGTVTEEELLPFIAHKINLFEEISFLTNLTINSVIPFDMSFKLRFALLKSINILTVQDIVSQVRLNKHISQFIKENREDCYIVTGNIDKWVEPIIKFLNCECFASTAREENNFLTELTYINRKSDAIASLRYKYDRIVTIGEGGNDIPMFKNSDISICYGGVHQPYHELLSYSNYITYDGERLCALLNTLL